MPTINGQFCLKKAVTRVEGFKHEGGRGAEGFKLKVKCNFFFFNVHAKSH